MLAEPDKVGSASIMKFKIDIIGQGVGSLNLYYGRIWELRQDFDSGKNVDAYIHKVIGIVASARVSEEL